MPKKNETTTRFKVDISQLKSAMAEAKRQVQIANSEFKAISSTMEDWTKSTNGISAKLKQLDTTLTSQKSVLTNLEKQYELTVKVMGEGSAEADRLKAQINNQKAAINQTQREMSKYDAELLKVDKAERDAAETGKSVADILGEDVVDATKDASDGFTVMRGALAKLVADGIEKALSALKDFAKESLQTGIDFESAMSEVVAISGATADEYARLEETARHYGETTVFSASQAAEALKYMALAGWDTETSISALGGVLDLAASSGMELAKASDVVTDYLSAFGMEAEQSSYLADMLSYAQANANTTAEQLSEAYGNSAASLHAAGQDVETVTALLSMMANQGLKGSEAGTALAAVMRDITAKMKSGAIAIGDTVVKVQDSEGNFRDLTDILKDVEKATEGMGDAEKASAVMSTFTARSLKGLNLILNAGVDEAESFENALRKSSGTAKSMGETMTDNLAGDLKELESAMESVKIELYKELEPYLRDFVQYLTTDGTKALRGVMGNLGELSKQSIPVLKNVLQSLLKVVGFVSENFSSLVTAGVSVATIFNTIKAAMAIGNTISAFSTAVSASTTAVNMATKAQLAWNAAQKANVLGAIISLITTLVVGIVALSDAEENAVGSTNRLNSAQQTTIDRYKELSESYKDVKESAEEVASAELANIDYTNRLWQELQNITDENGRVKDGYEARAEFILNQLNEALGTEYTLNGNIITQYGDMKKSVEELIATKKAETMLESFEERYKESIQNVANAEEARAVQAQELAKIEDSYERKRTEALEARDELNRKVANNEYQYNEAAMYAEIDRVNKLEESARAEKSLLNNKRSEYRTTDAQIKEYHDNIDAYERASALVLEGKTQEAVDALTKYSNGFKTVASTAELSANKQKAVLRQQAIDAQINLGIIAKEYYNTQASMTEAERKGAEERLKAAQQQAEEAKAEYEKVGGNLVLGIELGIKQHSTTVEGAMSTLIKNSIQAAKHAGDIHSPSKKTRDEVGKNLSLGVAKGIDDATKEVVKAINAQMKAAAKAYKDSSLSDAVIKEYDKFKKSHEVTLENEVKFWYNAVRTAKAGTADYLAVQEKYLEAIDKLRDEENKKRTETLNGYSDYVEKQKLFNKMSLADEVAYWQTAYKTFEKGTDQRLTAYKNYKSAKESLNKQILQLDKTYEEDTKKVYDQLTKDIDELTQKYTDSVNQRADSIVNSMSLFENFKPDEAVSKWELALNLESQVNGLKEWDETLDELENRSGMSSGLLEYLEGLGAGAIGTLKELNSMTDEELETYVKLFDEKERIAKERAEKENADLKEQTEKDIKDLTAVANKKLKELEKTYKKDLKALGVAVKDEAKTIGENIVDAIQSAIQSKSGALKDYLNSLVSDMVRSAQNSINSITASVNTASNSTSSGTKTATNSTTNSVSNVTYNQTINNLHANDRTEIYRQTKNLLTLNGGGYVRV